MSYLFVYIRSKQDHCQWHDNCTDHLDKKKTITTNNQSIDWIDENHPWKSIENLPVALSRNHPYLFTTFFNMICMYVVWCGVVASGAEEEEDDEWESVAMHAYWKTDTGNCRKISLMISSSKHTMLSCVCMYEWNKSMKNNNGRHLRVVYLLETFVWQIMAYICRDIRL